MKKPTSFLFAGLFLAALAPACKDENSPESLCTKFMETRKKDEWPAGDSVKKACVEELESRKKADAERYKSVSYCFSDDIVSSNVCFDANTLKYGFVADASGDWADAKPQKLGAAECNEGSYVISMRKLDLKLLGTEAARKDHEKELATACKQQRDDAAYAQMFACLRKATKMDEFMKCNPPVGAGGDDPVVIETCVAHCRPKAGDDPSNPEYQGCFQGCKANGGRASAGQ